MGEFSLMIFTNFVKSSIEIINLTKISCYMVYSCLWVVIYVHDCLLIVIDLQAYMYMYMCMYMHYVYTVLDIIFTRWLFNLQQPMHVVHH